VLQPSPARCVKLWMDLVRRPFHCDPRRVGDHVRAIKLEAFARITPARTPLAKGTRASRSRRTPLPEGSRYNIVGEVSTRRRAASIAGLCSRVATCEARVGFRAGVSYDWNVDARRLLTEGDALARAGQREAALDRYAQVAGWYVSTGHALKAIAVYVQIRRLVQACGQEAMAFDDVARLKLPLLYRMLGLDADAVAIESERSAPPGHS